MTAHDHSTNQLISHLLELQQKPVPFSPGEPLFWDDPHISAQMLGFHLNPDIDAASRRPETIAGSIKWLIEMLALKAGDSVLDLGCGPGLYASRFARAGLQVTGVDYSHRSIEYATRYANENNLNITYRYQNYLELKDDNQYDAALLIYGDFCPLSSEQRATLLHNIYRALKPGGKFVLDVTTREYRRKHGNKNRWYAAESGFWKPDPHLVLEEGFDYSENPSGSINTPSSKRMEKCPFIETGFKITHPKRSQTNWYKTISLSKVCGATCWAQPILQKANGLGS